jgi:uncharacterized Ntn-hydrolase superfamily protein
MSSAARAAFLAGLCLLLLFTGAPAAGDAPVISTFSIVGFDPANGDLGVAVQSRFFAVGSVVPWAEAEVGAIATQAAGNTTFGPAGLRLLSKGRSAEAVLAKLLAGDEGREHRQVGIVDANGRVANFTGKECMAWAGAVKGKHYTAQGNILVSGATVAAMGKAFENAGGELSEKLMAALEAGQAAGGDSRGQQSAALLVVRKAAGYAGFNDRYVDLRVDDSPRPIAELRRLLSIKQVENLIYRGYALVEKGSFDEAVETGRKAVALSRDDKGNPHYHLACYLSRAGRRDEALKELALALKKAPALRKQAATDTDLKPLHGNPRFEAMVRR